MSTPVSSHQYQFNQSQIISLSPFIDLMFFTYIVKLLKSEAASDHFHLDSQRKPLYFDRSVVKGAVSGLSEVLLTGDE